MLEDIRFHELMKTVEITKKYGVGCVFGKLSECSWRYPSKLPYDKMSERITFIMEYVY